MGEKAPSVVCMHCNLRLFADAVNGPKEDTAKKLLEEQTKTRESQERVESSQRRMEEESRRYNEAKLDAERKTLAIEEARLQKDSQHREQVSQMRFLGALAMDFTKKVIDVVE